LADAPKQFCCSVPFSNLHPLKEKKNAEKEEEEYTGGGTRRIHERNKKNYTGQ
jgi:hypothetical protein